MTPAMNTCRERCGTEKKNNPAWTKLAAALIILCFLLPPFTVSATVHNHNINTLSLSAKKDVRKISTTAVKLSKTTYTYDGHPKKPSVTVTYSGKKLKNGRDYTVSYRNNTKRGTAAVIVKGKGNYKGTVTKKFKIK